MFLKMSDLDLSRLLNLGHTTDRQTDTTDII